MKSILVVGAKGQLGQEIHYLTLGNDQFQFVDIENLDITSMDQVYRFFTDGEYQYCINCAAYTAVDKAETDSELARKINVDGVENLSRACLKNNVTLIHISTDFVFDGSLNRPLKEDDFCRPLGVYGETKREGEIVLESILENYFIIRTSWLYSSFGNNFPKTMIRLSNEREDINVIADQLGTPTYARDLAEVILNFINTKSTDYGIYHYSNEGVASWYDFAQSVFEITGSKMEVNPIATEKYPTPAKRPAFSVMDKEKIKSTFNIKIPHWRESLRICIMELEKQ